MPNAARLKYAALTSFAAAALSLAAGFLSWRTVRRNRSDASLDVTAYPQASASSAC